MENPQRYWYRGIDHPVRPSQIGWKETDLPQEVKNEIAPYGSDVYELYNYEFKISRTYRGMSNWGFGVYVTTDIAWAKRYGNDILICEVDPATILHITHRDFVDRNPETLGGRLHIMLEDEAGDSFADQASVMYRLVRKLKRDAKALFVQTSPDGEGQMCVFNRNYIQAKWITHLGD